MKQERRPQATADPRPAQHRLSPGVVGRVLFGCAAVLAAVYLAALGRQAAHGIFASDECFHAYMSEWLLIHHRLPSVLPEFYSGMFVFYPPLLHITGALWAALFGLRGLHVLPTVITGLTLAVVLIGAPRSVPAAARAQAVLLCLLNDSFVRYAGKLYVECLIPLLFAASVALLLEFRRTARMRYAVALGLVVGLAPLTKLNGWLLVGGIATIALACAIRREGRMARGLLVALVLGLGLVGPWLVRNQMLFGSALYPAFAPDVDRALYVLYRQKFSMPWLDFMRAVPAAIGPWGSVMTAVALTRAAFTRHWALREGLLILAVLGALGTAFIPMAQARHLTYFVPVLALTAAWSVAEALERRPWLQLGVGVVLVVAVITRLSNLPDYRAGADLPEHLREAFNGIKPRMRAGTTILSPWSYDTFYYTRRNATWPNPWGQRVRLVDLFYDRDPDRFAANLDRCSIDYLLVPNLVRMEPFNGSNYPESFVTCVRALVERGELAVVWQSPQMALVANARRGLAPPP
jgi:hypothetical protein